ncbi:hypothetical protein QTP88_008470 [Uroleucon formosanum]
MFTFVGLFKIKIIYYFTTAGESMDVVKILTNAQCNPTERQVYMMYDTWRNENFDTRVLESMADVLRSKKKLFDDNGIHGMVNENPFIVTVATPIMKRANQEKISGEIIFIDSIGSCDQSGSCVTFVFGSTKSGGIPLGCIIHHAGASYGVESVRVAEILYGDEAGKSFCYLQLWRTRLDLRCAAAAVAYNSYGVHAVSATTPCRGCFDAYNVLYTASAGRRVQFPDLRSDDDNLSPAETVHTHVYNTRSSLHTHYTQQIDTRTRPTTPSAPPSVVEDLRHLFTLRLPNDNL